MTTPRDAALDWVRRALVDELRDDSAETTTRAENLVAIAEQFQVSIEDLIKWIHFHAAGKQWSGAEFRRFCTIYTETRDRLFREFGKEAR